MLDFVIKVNKKCYPQTLLEEYKYIIKKNKMENLIDADLDLLHLIMRLIMNLIIDLTGGLMINFLRIKNVF